MNSTLIATFIALARTRNISGAACELNQVQSTVSKRLRQLEENVGHSLFDRRKGSKNISLTPEGEAFADIAERWLRLNDDLDLFKQPTRPKELRVGATDSMQGSFMKDIYRTVVDSEPDLRLTIRCLAFREPYAAVADRTLDAGFSFYEHAHASLDVEKLYSEPMVALRRSERSSWLEEPQPLHFLRREDEIYVPWADTQIIWRKAHLDPSVPPRMTVYPISMIVDFMEKIGLWCIVPQSFAATMVTKQPFCIFELTPPPPSRSCFYIKHKNPTAEGAAVLAVFERHFMPAIDELFGKKRDGNSELVARVKAGLRA